MVPADAAAVSVSRARRSPVGFEACSLGDGGLVDPVPGDRSNEGVGCGFVFVCDDGGAIGMPAAGHWRVPCPYRAPSAPGPSSNRRQHAAGPQGMGGEPRQPTGLPVAEADGNRTRQAAFAASTVLKTAGPTRHPDASTYQANPPATQRERQHPNRLLTCGDS